MDAQFHITLPLLILSSVFLAGSAVFWRLLQKTRREMKRIKIEEREDRRGLPRR